MENERLDDRGVTLGVEALPDGATIDAPGCSFDGVNKTWFVPWSVALRVLDESARADSVDSASPADDAIAVTAEILGPALRRCAWSKAWSGRIELGSRGTFTRPADFSLSVTWTRNGIPCRPPRLNGPIVQNSSGLPSERLSLAQWLCLDATAWTPIQNEMALRIRTERLLQAVGLANERSGAQTVSLEGYLATERAQIIESVSADIVPVGDGYQLTPRTSAMGDDEIENWYFTAGARTSYQRGLRSHNRAGAPRNVVFAEAALRTVSRLRQLNVIAADTVARVLDDPRAILGADLDLSQFSPRVRGIGVVSSERIGVVSESKVSGWFEHHGELGLADGFVDLSDINMCRAILAAIAEAKSKGLNWFLHPSRPDLFLPITDLLERRLRERAEAENNPTPTPRIGLVVHETMDEDNEEAKQFRGLGRLVPMPPLPRDIHEKLKRHQTVGVRWLLTLANQRETGALLADDMGLGKTLQVLSLLSALDVQGRRGPHLIVAPVGLLANWQRECDRYFPDQFHDQVVVQGDVRQSGLILGQASHTLVGYDTLRLNEFAFARVAWDVVILDEAQKIKNVTTQMNRVARSISARMRIALTGTPVENSLEELWAIMDWAVPGRLGALRSFRDTFIRPLATASAAEKQALSERLLHLLQPHFLRRLKNLELANDLPSIHFEKHKACLGSEQGRRYEEILAARKEGRIAPLPALQRLLDTCAHPALSDGLLASSVRGSAFPKAERLCGLLDDIASRDEKVIIFTNRRPIQDWLAELVHERFRIRPAIINGEVSSSEVRMDIVDKFSRRKGFNALVLGPRAAGVGLNITAANHVIHYTREWNPAIEAQATDRAYRMGQPRPVTVHTIVASDAPWGPTVEEKLAELLEKKQALIRRFVIPVEPTTIGADELLA